MGGKPCADRTQDIDKGCNVKSVSRGAILGQLLRPNYAQSIATNALCINKMSPLYELHGVLQIRMTLTDLCGAESERVYRRYVQRHKTVGLGKSTLEKFGDRRADLGVTNETKNTRSKKLRCCVPHPPFSLQLLGSRHHTKSIVCKATIENHRAIDPSTAHLELCRSPAFRWVRAPLVSQSRTIHLDTAAVIEELLHLKGLPRLATLCLQLAR